MSNNRSTEAYTTRPLADLAARITDGSHFSPEPQREGRLIANVKDMKHGAIDFESCTKISDGAYRELLSSGCTIKMGDVLLSKDGTVGRVVVYGRDEEIGALSSICLITPKPESSARFLGQALQSHGCVRQYDNFMSGSALRRLVLRDIRQIAIPMPPLEDQAAIADVLDTLDTTIHQTEAIIAKLKQVKQGLLYDLLTRGIGANSELRPPQSEAPHLYKASPLGWIPKNWEALQGRHVCSEIVVGIVVKPTQYYRDHGVPIFRSANVREPGLNLRDLVYMDPKDHWAQQKSCVKPGDVLTVRTGYPGTSCVVDAQVEEANCVDIIISRPGPTISPQYWAQWINSPKGKEQVLRVQGGLAQQHFNVGDLAAMQVSVPPQAEQQQIIDRLEAVNTRVKQEYASRNAMTDLKSGLMDDLLTGRVRVTPLLKQEVTT
jgi:type I restriction enzyme S subunit